MQSDSRPLFSPFLLGRDQRIPFGLQQLRDRIRLWGDDADSAHAVVTGTGSNLKGVIAANMFELVNDDHPAVAWIVDGGCLKSIAARANAQYIDLQTTRGRSTQSGVGGHGLLPPQDEPSICINPFWRPLGEDGQATPLYVDDKFDICRLLILMLESVGADLSRTEFRKDLPQLLFSALDECFKTEQEESPSREIVFSDFIGDLRKTSAGNEVADLLAPFHGEGAYASLFDGVSRLPPATGLAIFGTQPLENTPALAPAVCALHQQLGVRIRAEMPRGLKKVFMLNHAWEQHFTQIYADAICGLLRDFRRRNGSCIFISAESNALDRIQQLSATDYDGGIMACLSHHFEPIETPTGLDLRHTLLHERATKPAPAVAVQPSTAELMELDQKVEPLLSWARRFSDNPMAFLVETLQGKLHSPTQSK